jgi:hypothetical protein
MTITAGTIVLPQGDSDEHIVGIAITDSPTGWVSVLWLSDTRGAFVAEEWARDVTAASLNGRDDITDLRIDHKQLAEYAGILATLAEHRERA